MRISHFHKGHYILFTRFYSLYIGILKLSLHYKEQDETIDMMIVNILSFPNYSTTEYEHYPYIIINYQVIEEEAIPRQLRA